MNPVTFEFSCSLLFVMWHKISLFFAIFSAQLAELIV